MGTTDWQHYEIDLSPKPASGAPTAPPKKPVDKPLGSPAERLGAKVIDLILIYSPLVLVFLITRPGMESIEATAFRLRYYIIGMIGVYIIQATLLSIRGQSLGKLASGVRIVDYIDESNPGFVRCVLWRSLLPGLISVFPCLGTAFAVVDTVFIFKPDRRCIHDLFADTKS